MTTTTLTATEPTIWWPESEDDAPAGWHWGAHVSLGPQGSGYYLIHDSDGVALIAIQRPDLDEPPTEDDLEIALASVRAEMARRDADAEGV